MCIFQKQNSQSCHIQFLILSALFQTKHDELEAKFIKERAALQAKYQKLYEPLYSK